MTTAPDARAETRRRNTLLARRLQLGLISVGVAGSLGFTAAAALAETAADSAPDVEPGETATTPQSDGGTSTPQLGAPSGGSSHATTAGS